MDHLADARTAAVRDPSLPMLTTLLTESIPGPLQAAMQAAGRQVTKSRVAEVSWSPGVSARVSYHIQLAAASGEPEGQWIGPVVLATGRVPPGAFVVADGEHEVAVWRMPHDPALPGLASAVDPDTAGAVLEALGVPGPPVQTTIRAYRPGRRAVVAVSGRGHGLYLKVLRPGRAQAVHERHRWLADHLPVTQSLGIDPDLGILALQEMAGRTLREVLDDPGAPLPTPAALTALLGELPQPQRSDIALSPLERVVGAADALRRLLPDHASLITEVAGQIGAEDQEASVAVHGDFYESQVLLDGATITGLIDLDTYGWGRPGDDAATMLGHLSVYQGLSRQHDRVAEYGRALLAAWEPVLPPGELRRRTAATVWSLAPGAFRSQSLGWPEEALRRVHLAAAWVAG